MFFIRDGMKFPDMVHALKPNPKNHIQEDWRIADFFSHIPESMHMVRPSLTSPFHCSVSDAIVAVVVRCVIQNKHMFGARQDRRGRHGPFPRMCAMIMLCMDDRLLDLYATIRLRVNDMLLGSYATVRLRVSDMLVGCHAVHLPAR